MALHTRAVVLECRLNAAQATLVDPAATIEQWTAAASLVERMEASVPASGRGNRWIGQFAKAVESALATNVRADSEVDAADTRAFLALNQFRTMFPRYGEILTVDLVRPALLAWPSTAPERVAAVKTLAVALGEGHLDLVTIDRALRPSRRKNDAK